MPNLSLRFNKDMLTLTPHAEDYLRTAHDEDALHACLVGLLEPETLEHTYRMIMTTGAQCVTAPTSAFTPARLRALGMEHYSEILARNAVEATHAFSPQHVLLETGPCDLPFDQTNKTDMKEYCNQYASFGRLFENLGQEAQASTASPSGADIMPSLTLSNYDIDGYLLSGFESLAEIKCALIGLRKVTDKPIMISLRVNEDGKTSKDAASVEDAARACEDLEAAVFGIEVAIRKEEDFQIALALAKRTKAACNQPILVDLMLTETEDGQAAIEPDIMFDFGLALHKAGVQFVRASGKAGLSHTAVLAAATTGLDTVI